MSLHHNQRKTLFEKDHFVSDWKSYGQPNFSPNSTTVVAAMAAASGLAPELAHEPHLGPQAEAESLAAGWQGWRNPAVHWEWLF